MLKAGFCQAKRIPWKEHLQQGNRTPVKSRSPITRSPIKTTRRDCSPLKSPLRKHKPVAYNPPYVKINYINTKSPIKQRTPMKQLKDKYTTNTDQAYKFRQEPIGYSPAPRGETHQYPIVRKDSNKEDRDLKMNNYQLFSKLVKETRLEQDNALADKRNLKIDQVKFITGNFNSDPLLNKLQKYKENAPNIHGFNEIKKNIQLKRHLSNQQAQKPKPTIKQSMANFDRVLMSFDRPQSPLNMEPFL